MLDNPANLLVPSAVTASLAVMAAIFKLKEYRRIGDFGVFGVVSIMARIGIALVYFFTIPDFSEITWRSVLIRFFLTFLLMAEDVRFSLRWVRS